jgi:hypothetical protein
MNRELRSNLVGGFNPLLTAMGRFAFGTGIILGVTNGDFWVDAIAGVMVMGGSIIGWLNMDS